jgi:2-methylcitrate dehydratase PrpD
VYIFNEKVSSLTKKVMVLTKDEFTNLFPRYSPAEIVIKTYNNQTFIEKIDSPKGEPEIPLSDDELNDKFSSLVQYNTIKKFDSEKIISAVLILDNEISILFELL